MMKTSIKKIANAQREKSYLADWNRPNVCYRRELRCGCTRLFDGRRPYIGRRGPGPATETTPKIDLL